MSFWDKVKDFVGIEDDYYEEDEYYEDYDSEYDSLESTYAEREEEKVVINSDLEDKPKRSYQPQRYTSEVEKTRESRPVSRSYGATSDMQVAIKEPLKYEDGKTVIDDVLAGKTVVLNLEMLEMDMKTQIFYFVSGAVYALKGSISNVTKDIYVLSPEGVKVDGKIAQTVSDKSLYQI